MSTSTKNSEVKICIACGNEKIITYENDQDKKDIVSSLDKQIDIYSSVMKNKFNEVQETWNIWLEQRRIEILSSEGNKILNLLKNCVTDEFDPEYERMLFSSIIIDGNHIFYVSTFIYNNIVKYALHDGTKIDIGKTLSVRDNKITFNENNFVRFDEKISKIEIKRIIIPFVLNFFSKCEIETKHSTVFRTRPRDEVDVIECRKNIKGMSLD